MPDENRLRAGFFLASEAPEPLEVSPVARVVIVEDQEDLRDLTTSVLRERGHVVVEASDGLTGVATIARERPDVAFVDIGLPGLTGYEVAEHVRSQPELRSVFLVALTAYASPEHIRRARAAGFDHHITKPGLSDALEHAIRLAPRFASDTT